MVRPDRTHRGCAAAWDASSIPFSIREVLDMTLSRRLLVVSLLALAAPLAACGAGATKDDAHSLANGDSGDDGSLGDDSDPQFNLDAANTDVPAPCVGLQCQQQACSGGGTTSISGVVYDPAGKNPLYDIAVYVPNAPVAALTPGASCDSCESLYSGSPIVSALTDAQGKFTLKNVPVGANIPLVLQVGKWRRQVTIANVTACQDNPQPNKSLRLPNNHTVGDMPNIAIATGGADTLECLLRRIGIDANEYGPGNTNPSQRIHIFTGSGGAPTTAPSAPNAYSALWNNQANLMKFDMVLLSCEGDETTNMNQNALYAYANAGGRVFASHFHYSWFNSGPFGALNLATWSPGINDMNDINANIVTTLSSGGTFPKGVALHDWLQNTGALSGGKLPITQAKHNADVSASNTPSQPWIVSDSSSSPPNATEYFTFNTPVGQPADKQCGRVVYSDLHVGAASNDYSGLDFTVPAGCANDALSPQEKALEFMLFDLSACVVPDGVPPVPPTTPPQ
jgi:hypothetical protein